MPRCRLEDRRSRYLRLLLLIACLLLKVVLPNVPAAEPSPANIPLPAPTPPPPITADAGSIPDPQIGFRLMGGKQHYEIGELTDDEQAYVELINRARLDPRAEGRRLAETEDEEALRTYTFFDVDLDWMLNAPESGFNHLAPAGVLVPNAQLTEAARRHTRDMFQNTFQGHISSNGNRLGERASAAGYPFATVGENVFASALHVFHGHAGFNVDWGPGTGGIQEPPGHRLSIHNPVFKEIGVGVINDSKKKIPSAGPGGLDVGPQLVTQVFGTRHNIKPFITGVAYYDLNGNNFYDSGEGLGGIRIDVNGSDFYALTANSGGFGVPVSRNGNWQVTFSGPGFAEETVRAVVANSENAKVDFSPIYRPPQISGADTIPIGSDTAFTFSTVGGATAYQWQQSRLRPIAGIQGAETGLNNFTAQTTGNYSPRTSTVQASGQFAFHLFHTTADNQTLTWNRVFRPGTNATLRFQSRLTLATPQEIAQVEISDEKGANWTALWSQAGETEVGSFQSGESQFRRQTIDLSPFALKPIRLRFVFALRNGQFYSRSPGPIGWYFDNLELTDTTEIIEPALHRAETPGRFAFRPPRRDDWLLRVRARISDHWYPFGPTKLVKARDITTPTLPPIPPVLSPPSILRIEFSGFGALLKWGGGEKLQVASSVTGPWEDVIDAISPYNIQLFLETRSERQQFFRIVPRDPAP